MEKINYQRLVQLTLKLQSKVNTTEEYLEYLKMHALLNQYVKMERYSTKSTEW